jgi:hypothetical protein
VNMVLIYYMKIFIKAIKPTKMVLK